MTVPADKIVLTSCMVTLSSTTAATMLPEKYGGLGELPSPKLLIGTSLAFMGLSMFADFAPAIAGPLSAAIAVTALTYYGLPVLDKWFADEPTKPKPAKGAPKKGAAQPTTTTKG